MLSDLRNVSGKCENDPKVSDLGRYLHYGVRSFGLLHLCTIVSGTGKDSNFSRG